MYSDRMLPSKINSLHEVASLVQWFFYEKNVNFHPDTPVEDYINRQTREPSFMISESQQLNSLIDEAFLFCEKNGEDFYSIGFEIGRPLLLG